MKSLETKVHIKDDQLICPRCGEALHTLGTMVANSQTGFVGECRELTCKALVHFQIQVFSVTVPSRLIHTDRKNGR